MLKIGLFIPCYIDQLYPEAGKASMSLLEKVGCEVIFLEDILCCGQPMANSGYLKLIQDKGYQKDFLDVLPELDFLVTPSGSCTYHLKNHLLKGLSAEESGKVLEITEFLHDVIGPENIHAEFPHKVALHQSCHGLRGLNLAVSSELQFPKFSKIENLLKRVKGLDLVIPENSDECCGFGGSFAVMENAVSVKMGEDKMMTILKENSSIVTATDSSCLMHLQGVFDKNEVEIKVMHIVEILNAEG